MILARFRQGIKWGDFGEVYSRHFQTYNFVVNLEGKRHYIPAYCANSHFRMTSDNEEPENLTYNRHTKNAHKWAFFM